MPPLVSITIPAYNQAHFLEETVRSALGQTYPNIEILIMDDGSTDATPQVAQKFAELDKRVRYFRQENQGVSTTRNNAIQQAKGEFICMLESDDVMEKEKVEKQVEVFLKHPEVDVVYTAVSFIDAEGKKIGEMHGTDMAPENFLAYLFFRNLIACPSCMMARRQCLLENRYNTSFRQVDDYELTIRLAHKHQFKYLDEPLTRYRRHKENISNDLTLHRNAELRILRSYSHAHIEQVVDHSLFSSEEKEFLKGKIFFNLELFDKAIPFFEKEGSPLAYFYLGNCYLKKGDLVKAKECYQTSIEGDPQNAACWNNLGTLEKNRSYFEKALSLKPGYLDAMDNLKTVAAERDAPLKTTFRELRPQLVPYQM